MESLAVRLSGKRLNLNVFQYMKGFFFVCLCALADSQTLQLFELNPHHLDNSDPSVVSATRRVIAAGRGGECEDFFREERVEALSQQTVC